METATRARQLSHVLSVASTEQKNAALAAFRDGLVAKKDFFNKANATDKEMAEKEVAAGRMLPTMLDRIGCSSHAFDEMISGIDDIIKLDDPVGKCDFARQMAKDLNLFRVTSPIGVILVIFEARPDAAVGILSLCLKSGNCAVLKGGAEATNSMKAIQSILDDALRTVKGVPVGVIQCIYTREEATELYKLDTLVDLIVPRGSNELVRHIKHSTTIPVLGHADGLCTVYVDNEVDMQTALKVVDDSKNQYPAACNALETLLVHEAVAPKFLVALGQSLQSQNVKYRADEKSIPHLPADVVSPAAPQDYRTEFLEKVMAVKCVKDVHEAITHINNFGSGHTDVILTTNAKTADIFMRGVDSAGVYCNCSSRFADGFRYGFGAEVGISTNRIHARGPVGLEGLVTYRYRIYGKGQCVADFSNNLSEATRLKYEHKDLPRQNLDNEQKVAQFQQAFFA